MKYIKNLLIDEDEIYQKGLIITDNFSRKPILDFDAYRDAIVKIIKKSYPNFTIGVFGEWGTGKTSLMNSIRQELDNKDKKDIKTIWFDAWKYENEKEFALIPLLKTIAFSLKEDKKYDNLKDALKEAAIFTLDVSRDLISSVVTTHIGDSMGGLFKKSLEDVTGKLIPKLKELNEVDKNAIFYNGIENIQNEIDKLRNKNNDGNPNLRFVIFIDDLDRCSPEKVLEILETIKIFLSLNGIIYVLGVSHDTIVNLINEKYKIDGEKYLKKFIQIPITLTEWNESDINSLINYLLENNIIHRDYKPIIEENKDIIASAIEENPRETKRFLNNLIISYEVFVNIHQQNIQSDDERKKFLKQLLLVQILNSNWKEIYKYIIHSNGSFLKDLEKFIPLDSNKIDEILKPESQYKIDSRLQRVLKNNKSNIKLWNLLNKDNFPLLTEIDWKIFRRALKVTSDESFVKQEKAFELLATGRIKEFNDIRKKDPMERLDLSDAALPGANLSGAFLEYADLKNADLSGADLSGADLRFAYLDSANLSGADLSGAYISGTFMRYTNLSGANLTYSIIIYTPLYDNLIVNEETNFTNAIIDDPKFIDYIKKFTRKVPNKIKNKKELKTKLEERKLKQVFIELFLQSAKLPD